MAHQPATAGAMAAGHFPTASEAFQVVTKAVQDGTFRDFEVVLEYADGPDRSVPSAARKLSSMRQEKSGKNRPERQYQPAFRPPCGWQRIWRITHQEDVVWDRQVHRCTLPLPPATAAAASVALGSGGSFGLLPAAVVARVILSCDLCSLLSLAAALPSLGAAAPELGEALPAARGGAKRWLSFARSALRWADLLGGLRQGLVATAGGRAKKGREIWVASDPVAPHCASAFAAAVASEASCAAAAPALLATGHQDGVRLWGLPGGTKMGLVKTRSPVLALDLGGPTSDLLAAVLVCSQSPRFFWVALWDLSSLNAAATPVWQVQAPSMVVHFLGSKVVVSSPTGVQLLCAVTGQPLESIELGGMPGSSCKSPLPPSWSAGYGASAMPRLEKQHCVLLAAKQKVLAVTEGLAPTAVQRCEVFEFAPETTEEITALSCSATEVAAGTRAGRVFVWRLADRALLARLPAVSEFDLENLSWSVCRAETLAGLRDENGPAIAQILLVEELLVCCVNLGQPGQDSAVALMAWHVPSCTRLPHPWHLAGPLEASPTSRATATAPVLLPGISVGRLLADPSLRWVTVSHFASSSRQPVACILTRAAKPLRRGGR